MLAWQGGDEQAFHELVDVYSGQVYALLTRFLGRGHPGREDLVQEVFLRVVKARARYTATARFSTWLYTIVWRICINETEQVGGDVEQRERMIRDFFEEYFPVAAPWERSG